MTLFAAYAAPLAANDAERFKQALTYYHLGRGEDSISDLQKAEAIIQDLMHDDASDYEYPYYLASILYHHAVLLYDDTAAALESNRKAVAMVRQAIRLNPGYSDSHRLYADCLNLLMRTTNFRNADVQNRMVFRELESARRLDPRNSDVYVSYGMTYAHRSKLSGGGYAKAIAYLKRALALDNYSYQAHYWLGVVYRKTGRLDDAVESLDRAIAILPSPAFAQVERKKAIVERDSIKRCQGRIAGNVAVSGVTRHASMGRLILAPGERIDSSALLESKRRLADIPDVNDVSIEIAEKSDGRADVIFHCEQNRIDVSVFRVALIHVEPLVDPNPVRTVRNHIPLVSLLYYKNILFHDEISGLFVLTNFSQQADIKVRHLGATPLTLEIDYNGTLFTAGKTRFTVFNLVQNSYDAHEFKLGVMPGVWIVDNLLKLSLIHTVDYQKFIRSEMRTDFPRKIPADGFIDTSGVQLCYNTLNYLGNKGSEGSYAAFQFDFAYPGMGSRFTFERYRIDLQHNIFFSHGLRLFLMLRGGITRGINKPEEETQLYYIGGGRRAMADPSAHVVHGFYDREYEANNFILSNVGFRFPLFWKFSCEVDGDYGYIADKYRRAFGRRHVFGSALSLIFDCLDHLTLQTTFGYGYNSKREGGNAYEIGGKIEGYF